MRIYIYLISFLIIILDIVNSNNIISSKIYPVNISKQLEELTQKENVLFGEFKRERAIILGELSPGAKRITLDEVNKFIQESNSFTEIYKKINSVQKYPDFIGGSGVTNIDYWIDDNGTQKINIIYEQEDILYIQYSNDGKIIKRELLYPIEKQNNKNTLPESIEKALEELTQKENMMFGEFKRKRAIILGELSPNAKRITLDEVNKFIQESNSFTDIYKKINSVQKYPDFIGGSGVTNIDYWIDDNGTQKINIIYEQEDIVYIQYSNDRKIIKRELLYPIEKQNNKNTLPESIEKALEELTQKENMMFGEFKRERAIILGELSPDAKRITLDEVNKFIQESNSFTDIYKKINSVQKYPDFIGGSGVTNIDYWIDDNGTQKINIIYEQEDIVYIQYSNDGKIIKRELLYPIKNQNNNSLYNVNVDKKLEELTQKENMMFGEFKRERAIILGELSPGAKRITLDEVNMFIQESSSFTEIYKKINSVQKYPDFIGGSAVTNIDYWIDDDGSQKINIIYEQEDIVYIQYSNERKIIKRELLYPIEKQNNKNTLPESIEKALEELTQKENMMFGEFKRERAIILGELSPDAKRITLDEVNKFIQESSSFTEIYKKINSVQKYPDFIGGSGVTNIDYWIDDNGTQKINIIYEQEDILYIQYSNDGKIIKRELLYPIEKQNNKNTLPESIEKALEELTQKENMMFGEFKRERAIILGELSPDAKRITLDEVNKFIQESSSFTDIYKKISSVQKYPDFIGGSGVTNIDYWIDDNGTQKINIIYEQEDIVYTQYSNDGKIIKRELLYPIKNQNNNSLYNVNVDKKLEELTQKENMMFGEFKRKRAIILGELSPDAKRITLDEVNMFIQESSSFTEIYKKINSVQKYPDFIGGSGVTNIDYWIDDNGIQKINIIYEQEDIVYIQYSNDGKIIKRELLYPIEKQNNKNTLPESIEKALEELTQKENMMFGEFKRKRAIILGELSPDAKRITLDEVNKFIQESNSFTDIYKKISSVQKYPDFIGGSGVTNIDYWIDDNGTQKINIIYEQEDIVYIQYSNDRKIIKRELLYPVKKNIENFNTTTCIPKSITKIITDHQTITVKEKITVTVTIQSKSTPDTHCAKKWSQCGGRNYKGPTCCQSGSSCHKINKFYSQCT